MAGISKRAAGPLRALLAAALTAALPGALTGCGAGVLWAPAGPGGAWLQAGGSATGAGHRAPGPEPPLRLRWQQRIGKPPLGSPLLAGGLLLQWSKAPDLYAFDVVTGTRRGQHRSDDPVCGAGALAGPDAVFAVVTVLEDDGQLRALDRREGGDVAWHREGAVCAPVAVRGDTLYAAGENGEVSALAAADGQVLWHLRLPGRPLRYAPTLVGDTLYVVDGRSLLVAATADSGHVLWRAHLGAPPRTRPVVDAAAGRVVVATVDGRLRGFQAVAGDSVWSAPLPGLAGGLHLAAGRVVVGSSDHGVYAFAAADGAALWSYRTGGVVRAAPTGTDETVYVPSGDGWLYALDAASGALRWRYQLDAPGWTPAALGPGLLAVTSEAGTLYVFGGR